jgi:hypothetical protein
MIKETEIVCPPGQQEDEAVLKALLPQHSISHKQRLTVLKYSNALLMRVAVR